MNLISKNINIDFIHYSKYTFWISLSIIVIGFIVLGPIFGIIGLAIVLIIASLIQAVFLVIVDKVESGERYVKRN